ncbi:hypothetical protein F4860DRAFT_482926 [Xylaria cubensis]|nr:hypothetical protein F4860DRAFT_482926 [Xylaria cubensis]
MTLAHLGILRLTIIYLQHHLRSFLLSQCFLLIAPGAGLYFVNRSCLGILGGDKASVNSCLVNLLVPLPVHNEGFSLGCPVCRNFVTAHCQTAQELIESEIGDLFVRAWLRYQVLQPRRPRCSHSHFQHHCCPYLPARIHHCRLPHPPPLHPQRNQPLVQTRACQCIYCPSAP